MKFLKRLFLFLLVLIVLVVGAAVILPIVYKDKIVERLKTEINKNVRAEVDFADVDLSLFRSFPKLSVGITDLTVNGVDEFEGVHLAKGKSVLATMDLNTLFNQDAPLTINRIELIEPDINILVTEDGKANYDITVPTDERIKETSSQTDLGNFRGSLESYEIRDAKITYDDQSTNTFLSIADLDHQGTGDFSLETFDLDTDTEVQDMTVSYDGVSYLTKADLVLDAIFGVDLKKNRYTLQDNKLRVNALDLTADGYVEMQEADDIMLDLEVNAPGNNFKELLSLIPNAYIQGYENVKANGQFSLAAMVKGVFNGGKSQYPAFRIKTDVRSGSVQYPDLPVGISGINTNIDVNSPSSDFDDLTVDVPRFSVKIGDQPFDGSFNLKTPISDPDMKLRADGVIDLKQLSQAFPIEGMEQLAGIIDADVRVDTRLSTIEEERYDEVDMTGQVKVADLVYRAAGLPAVKVDAAAADFTPQRVNINSFSGQLGKSDVQASGHIDNLLAYFSPKKTMTGDLTVRSKSFNLDEWMVSEEPASYGNSDTPATSGTETAAAAAAPFDRFDFKLDAKADRIVYSTYDIKAAGAKGRIKANELVIEDAEAELGRSDFKANGAVTNMWEYVFNDGTLGGDLNLRSDVIDLNEFMESPEGSSTTTASSSESVSAATITIPDNIGMRIKAKAGTVLYDNMVLNQVDGVVNVADQAAVIETATAKMLGGDIDISGGYNTVNPEQPEFKLKYDVKEVDFQQAFKTFNTFQALAPVGKYIKGKLSTSLIMDGTLGNDLMPLLTSLNADGFIGTINGKLAGFAPLQKIGNALNIEEFKEEIDLGYTKNWFTISDGKITVEPFDLNIKDIPMKVSGFHGLDMDMNYVIDAKIPREKLGDLNKLADAGLSALSDQASKLGLNLQQSDVVNVRINLTGSATDPKVGFKLLGLDGDGSGSVKDVAENIVKEKLDEEKEKLEEQANKELDKAKEKANETITEVRDSIATIAEQEADKVKEQIKDKAGEVIGEQVGGLIDSTKVGDILKDAGKGKIEDKLKEWNPFGKKKKKKDGGG